MDGYLLPEDSKALLESAGAWKARRELHLNGQNNGGGAAGELAFCHTRCQKVSESYQMVPFPVSLNFTIYASSWLFVCMSVCLYDC